MTFSSLFVWLLKPIICLICRCPVIVIFVFRGCKGTGTRSQPRALDLDFPAGIRSGMELRISAQGHAGVRGARSGDLFVKVNIRPHPRFNLVQDDIHVTVPLTLKQVSWDTRWYRWWLHKMLTPRFCRFVLISNKSNNLRHFSVFLVVKFLSQLLMENSNWVLDLGLSQEKSKY